jgi:hypothetical protein
MSLFAQGVLVYMYKGRERVRTDELQRLSSSVPSSRRLSNSRNLLAGFLCGKKATAYGKPKKLMGIVQKETLTHA